MRRDDQLPAKGRTSRRLNRFAPLLILLFGAGCFVFIAVNPAQGAQLDYLLVLSAVVFATVGSLILHRTDGNRVGWVMAATGLALFAAGVAAILADRGEAVAAAIGGAVWLSWFVLVGLLMYWFPTGRPVSPRWRGVGWLGVILAVMSLSYIVSGELCLSDGPAGCEVWVDNPIGIDGVPNPEYGDLSVVGFVALLGFLLLASVSFVVRFVRSRGVERLQLKWFAFAVMGVIVSMIAQETLAGLTPIPTVAWEALWSLSILALPIAIGVSVLRYRLYEIDRIVSRTVSYLLVVGLLAVVYLGGFLLITEVLSLESDLGVAAATLGVAALFDPVRRRIQQAVDRRFNRSRYNTQKVMDDFSGTLQGRVDSDDLVEGWVGVVSETMQPATIAVWIRA